jgi:hypothetical protein
MLYSRYRAKQISRSLTHDLIMKLSNLFKLQLTTDGKRILAELYPNESISQGSYVPAPKAQAGDTVCEDDKLMSGVISCKKIK